MKMMVEMGSDRYHTVESICFYLVQIQFMTEHSITDVRKTLAEQRGECELGGCCGSDGDKSNKSK